MEEPWAGEDRGEPPRIRSLTAMHQETESTIVMHKLWRSALLLSQPDVLHGCTSKYYGRLAYQGQRDALIDGNRARLAKDCGFSPSKAVLANHKRTSPAVITVTKDTRMGIFFADDELLKGNALITRERNTTLVARSNDCVPILFYDVGTGAIGAAHADWMATLEGVAAMTINAMSTEFGTSADDLRIAIGPCVHVENYDISTSSDERVAVVEELFPRPDEILLRQGSSVGLDLVKATVFHCVNSGVPRHNIEASDICTCAHSHTWPSYRGNGKRTGRHIWSFIGTHVHTEAADDERAILQE